MLSYFAPGSSVTRETALIAACSIVVINFVSSLCTQQYYVGTQLIGVKVRAACVSLIYRKVNYYVPGKSQKKFDPNK